MRDRLTVEATALADLGLRTALAAAISVPAGLWTLRGSLDRELERLVLYADAAAAGDADAVFARPEPHAAARVHGTPARIAGGRRLTLRLDSTFRTLHPELREAYAAYGENAVAWGQHWVHDDGPRPTLMVIHGFGASPYAFNARFFGLRELFEAGYDILLYLLPFHGVRQARYAAFNGWGLFAHGVAHLNEALLHAVHDARLLIDHLEEGGATSVAVTGLSLGGYVTAALGCADARPVALIPNCPVVAIDRLVREWFPANALAWATLLAAGAEPGPIEAALAVHSPLNYPSLVPRERQLIIGGLGDRLAPPAQAELLWEHWGRPDLHWFPGSHLLHVGRGEYLPRMKRFLDRYSETTGVT